MKERDREGKKAIERQIGRDIYIGNERERERVKETESEREWQTDRQTDR